MEVHFSPETESRLKELATQTGRTPADLVADAIAGYLEHLALTREIVDQRYDDIKSGRIEPIDGPSFFENLRQREQEMLKPRSTK